MKIAVIGLPQSGKSTVFRAASGRVDTGEHGKSAHRAVVKVPEPRLEPLAVLVSTTKIVYAEVEFLDAGGFSGKGKDSAPLLIGSDLKQMDTLLLTLDCFSGTRDPKVDLQTALDEMILNDLAQIEGKVGKLEKLAQTASGRERLREVEVLKKCQAALEDGRPLIELELSGDDEKEIRGYTFISLKPILIVLNIAEEDLPKIAEWEAKFGTHVSPGKRELAALCGKIEVELAAMEPTDRQAFLADLGITRPAVELVIQKAYRLLGLISYFTAGEKEARAWTITKGASAQKSAGAIHSDIERGFIRAEVVSYGDYLAYKTLPEIKKAGKFRLEGKEYVMQEGDVVTFRFNV